jgi:hypothetical protein
VAANKSRTLNEGDATFLCEIAEGDKESWISQLSEVNKVVAAVPDRVDNEYRVVFAKEMDTGRDVSYMFHKASTRYIKMIRQGVYG